MKLMTSTLKLNNLFVFKFYKIIKNKIKKEMHLLSATTIHACLGKQIAWWATRKDFKKESESLICKLVGIYIF
jgi:hypothetical protein